MLLGLAGLASACGGDDAPEECVGHACADAPIGLPEGGEVRLELVYLQDGATEVRAHAWFASDQTPASRPWPRPPENWLIQDGNDLCADISDGSFFPSGVPESRTYQEAGDTVEFEGEDGTLVLDRAENVQDWANDAYHDVVYLADIEPSEVELETDYGFHIPGDDLPEQTVVNAIKVPADYEVTYPDMNEEVLIRYNQDYRFTWSTTSDDPLDFAFVAFSDAVGPYQFCIGPQTGYMTIPEEVIDELPTGGVVLHGLINHRVIESEGRRIDFVGINCHSSLFRLSPGL